MKQNTGRFLLFAFISYLMIQAVLEFQKIAWGTGRWWGEYSLKWGLVFILFIVFNILLLAMIAVVLWRIEQIRPALQKIAIIREKLGIFRWVLVFSLFVFPVWLLQYTPWGLVFRNINLRLWLWGLVVVMLAILLKRGTTIFGWNEFIAAIIVTSTEFTVAQAFLRVSDYPFSMGWSEGNRMWDYSVLFGSEIYNYPLDQKIPVLLDTSRQFVGGLPFLFPGITIEMERAWLGISILLPYVLLGFAAFKFIRNNISVWILTTLWVLLFLKQGPIHPPLVLCAVAVALIWRKPLWLALPLIAVTGYAAEASRYTWLFAPGLWIGMLELAGSELENKKISRHTWIRAVALGVTGAAGGYFGTKIIGIIIGNINASAAITVSSVTNSVTAQALLWYRLLPNATYGNGILLGLAITVLPLIIVLSHLIASRKWILNIWQSLAIVVPLTAFLVVGLVASTKIGGGGDLHNMDMFLIGLMFVGTIAWRNGGGEWFKNFSASPLIVNIFFALMFILPGIAPLASLRTYEYYGDTTWLITLTDSPAEKDMDLLPHPSVVDHSLKIIQNEVMLARESGEVLFIDQRQLLTFGFIMDIPLVPEYEKKVLMDRALRSDGKYFETYYKDLAAQRFSLVVSELLRSPVKDSAYQFGEENNAWVKWVSNPTLCYYEPKITLSEVGVQLLVPKHEPVDCSEQLP
ncbi:MAG: hypothetical protein Q7T89_02230 [Anaerolineales bacterium]|nr:hypothetical protein [Anaerolineales bacterium]